MNQALPIGRNIPLHDVRDVAVVGSESAGCTANTIIDHTDCSLSTMSATYCIPFPI